MASFYDLLQTISRSTISQQCPPKIQTAHSLKDNSISSRNATSTSRSSSASYRESIWTLDDGISIDRDEVVKLRELSQLLRKRFAEDKEEETSGRLSTFISRVRAIPLSLSNSWQSIVGRANP